MRAMLAALGRDPRRTAWRLGLATAGVLLTAAVVAFRPAGSPCDGGSAELAAAFGPARRTALRNGLLASGVLEAPALADRTLAAIDAYAARFGAAHLEACEATRVRGVQSEELLDVRMECLAQNLRGLSTVTDLLAHCLLYTSPSPRDS